MNEFEDMILPDDFSEDTTPTETTDTLETPVETDSTPDVPAEQQTPQEALQSLRIKYNKEERDIPLDEAIPLVQKGLNYDKVQERLQALESDPRLSFVEQLAGDFGMTVEEYIQAVQQQKEQARIDELVQQGISEEMAAEMLENRKFRQQFEAEKKAKAENEKRNAEYNDFFDYFRQANGRDFVPNQDTIPDEVWQTANSGVPLKFAFMAHENQQLRNQLTTLRQNETNAKKAPVQSVSAHGGLEIDSEDEFLAGFNSI